MAFRKMTKQKYPPRLWSLVGYPGSGKSTFAAQMRGSLLVVDADHRFQEVLDLAGERDVYELSDVASDNTDPDRVAALLAKNMPGADVGTIVVDSLTAIIAPLVTQAMVDKDAGREKNLAAAFRGKALAMRQLQDAVTKWGTDCLWVYHLQDARDAKGKALVKATVSQTELARLTRSINLQLEIVQDGDRRGVKVVWARRGRDGMTIWDETGTWAGMPERIEEAVYAGLSEADQEQIEQEIPDVFPSPEVAIAWGLERGAFSALQHARNAYEKLKREDQPKDAREMTCLWVADVQARLMAANGNGGAG
ncbi:MAG: AAA family ATPase [Anaerolineae bacterium]|nr:AAA family ATPase [Anaerolineae bacterium]